MAVASSTMDIDKFAITLSYHTIATTRTARLETSPLIVLVVVGGNGRGMGGLFSLSTRKV